MNPSDFNIREIAESVALLAKADKKDPKDIFGKTTNMLLLAEAYANHRERKYAEASRIIKTWSDMPPKIQRHYKELFLVWKTQL